MRLTAAHQMILLISLSLGEYIHNLFELPRLSLLSPENSFPALVSAALVLAWCLLPSKRLPTLALLIWAFVHLIGGGLLSVLPLPFLPFFPAQTHFHYLMHGIYGLAQLPLIIFLVWQLNGQPRNERMRQHRHEY